MSDDHNADRGRDRDGPGPGAEEDPLFAERPGGASGRPDADADGDDDAGAGPAEAPGVGAEAGAPDETAAPPPLDEDAVAKHRAAKLARIRRRQGGGADGQAGDAAGPRADRAPVPARAAPGKGRPARQPSALPAIRPEVRADTPALRAERVEAIRRDLVRRRRRKGLGMLLKLWAFVALPTMAVAWFLWFEASDLYRSESSFVVQSRESAAGIGTSGGFLGALLGGGGGIYDPVAVQTYILSRDVLQRLDQEHGWIAHFQSPQLDVLHRLPPDASFEDAYDHYSDMVEVSFDPTEGLIEMSVVAAGPDEAQRFGQSIIGYSEEMVDELSNRIRTDAIEDAERNLAAAEERLKAAQEQEAELRKTLDTFSVEGEFATEMGIIAGMETELEDMKGKLSGLRQVTSDSDPRVGRLRDQIATLSAQVEKRRANVTGAGRGEAGSLADIHADLARAQLDVQAGMAIFTAALEAREIARADAARQHRYLSVVAAPSLPDEPNYPQKWQVTALAFLGFLGGYIVISLTVSLIREQASI